MNPALPKRLRAKARPGSTLEVAALPLQQSVVGGEPDLFEVFDRLVPFQKLHQRNGIRASVEGDARGMIVGQY